LLTHTARLDIETQRRIPAVLATEGKTFHLTELLGEVMVVEASVASAGQLQDRVRVTGAGWTDTSKAVARNNVLEGIE
jgi:hypothetical protein